MSMQDPIADMFVRIKNAQMMGKELVGMPTSRFKIAIAKLLKDEGYIVDWQLTEATGRKSWSMLHLHLKYHLGRPVIETLKRVSRPSIRIYRGLSDLPRVMNGLGVAIISTPKGLMSDRKARLMKQGGEIVGIVA